VDFTTPAVIEAAFNEIKSKQKLRERVQATATPEIASAVSNVYQKAQYVTPAAALSLAKGNASPGAVELANNLSAQQQLTEQETPKGFIQKFFYEPVKAVSRYAMAGFNLAPELIQNVASQAFKPEPTLSGVFKSTTLGSLLADPDGAGNGFFVGEAVADAQAQRAREYRGKVNNSAFTLGRSAASTFFPEKSLAFRLLSGAIDGAIQFIDPTIALGKVNKGFRLTGEIFGMKLASGALIPDTTAVVQHIDELTKAGKVAEAEAAQKVLKESLDAADEAANLGQKGPRIYSETRAVQRSQELADAGVISQAREALDASQFGRWWSANRGARRFEKRATTIVKEYTDDTTRLKNSLNEARQKLDTLFEERRRIRLDERQTAAFRNDVDSVRAEIKRLEDKIETQRGYHAYRIQNEMFNGQITGQQALKLLDTAEQGGIRTVFAEAAAKLRTTADQRPGNFVTDIRDLAAARVRPLNELANATYMRVPAVKKFVTKWASKMPDSIMIVKGNPRDRFEAVRNIERYMKTLGGRMPEEVFRSVLGRAFQAYNASTANPVGIYEARNVIQNVVEETLRYGYKVPEGMIGSLMKKNEEMIAKMRNRIATEIGKNPGHNLVRMLVDEYGLNEQDIIRTLAGNGVQINSIDDLNAKITSPTILAELLNNVQFLPDVRKMRALATNPFWRKTMGRITRTAEGDPRAIFEATEFFQNEIWKPFTLMNPGYFLRNIFDGQAHLYLENEGGLSSMLNKPFAFFSWVLGNRGAAGIAGETFTAEARKKLVRYGDDLMPAEEAYFRAQGLRSMKHIGNPTDAIERVVLDGNYGFTTRLDNPELHTIGILDQLAFLNSDPVIRPALARAANSRDIDEFMAWLDTKPDLVAQFQDLADNGFVYGVEQGRTMRIKMPAGMSPEDRLRTWVQTEIYGRVNKFKDVPELRVMAAHNRVPIIEPGNSRAIIDEFVVGRDVLPEDIVYVEGKPGVGTIFKGKDNFADRDFVVIGVKRKSIQPDAINNPTLYVQRDIYEAVPVYKVEFEQVLPGVRDKGRAFVKEGGAGRGGRVYDEELKRIINSVYDSADNTNNELIPAFTGFAMRHKEGEAKYATKWLGKWREFTDFFFNGLIQTGTNYLEKSPIWRQYYYKNVRENANLLSPAAFNEMIATVQKNAAELGMSPNQYIGGGRGNKLWKELQEMGGKANGVGTVEQLSEFAGNRATIRMKEILYDAAQRSNAEDALRVMAPFAAAWREVLTKYVTQFADDPSNFRRVQRSFVGLTNMDLEGDGTGFFYTDPQSGQMVFNYPLTDKASKLFTGLTAPLAAPVKGLSMGFQFNPSLGPVAQIGFNQIAKFAPKENDLRKFFAPYGTPGSDILDFTPGYIRKLVSAIKADPTELDGVFGQTYVEVVRALDATGKYDMTNPESRESLFNDAVGKARILTMFRALNQFIGPASGATKFEIDTKEGDVYMSQLIKAFQDMQEKDYEEAIPEFLDTFGDEVMMYVSGKSRAEVGGIQPTEKFEQWAKDNKVLMNRYKGVAGFFASGQDDFSFTAWKAQVDRGERVRLTAQEIVEQAEKMVGSALYRQARLKYGAYPTKPQQDWLRQYRIALHNKYPGFPEMPSFDPSEFPQFLSELRDMLNEPSLANNDVAIATRSYLAERDQALAQAAAAGLSSLKSKRVAPLRNYLARVADVLMEKYPDFKRIFEQKLQAELLQYEEE
jgi:hypothetical protein